MGKVIRIFLFGSIEKQYFCRRFLGFFFAFILFFSSGLIVSCSGGGGGSEANNGNETLKKLYWNEADWNESVWQ